MQREMQFGCQNGSFSCNFFHYSEALEFQQGWNFMERKSLLYNEIGEAKERVERENYAAMNDEILLKYHTTLNCDLMLIGTPITQVSSVHHPDQPITQASSEPRSGHYPV